MVLLVVFNILKQKQANSVALGDTNPQAFCLYVIVGIFNVPRCTVENCCRTPDKSCFLLKLFDVCILLFYITETKHVGMSVLYF